MARCKIDGNKRDRYWVCVERSKGCTTEYYGAHHKALKYIETQECQYRVVQPLPEEPATRRQLDYLQRLLWDAGPSAAGDFGLADGIPASITKAEASKIISALKEDY